MKKRFLTAVAILSAISMNLMAEQYVSTASITFDSAPEGAASGKAIFKVAADKEVYFSQGNLQYQASTNTWRFAATQYEYIGNVTANSNPADNQSEWMDLFRWGTSNQDAADPTYSNRTKPNYAYVKIGSQYDQKYYFNSENTYLESGDIANTNYDWGVKNPISNGGNVAGQWRTLTITEWQYLFARQQEIGGAIFTHITVNSVVYKGLLLKPENYGGPTLPTPSSNIYSCTESEWIAFQTAGCVFLTGAGCLTISQYDKTINCGGTARYWSSTTGGKSSSHGLSNQYRTAYYVWINALVSQTSYSAQYDDSRYDQYAVRLVQDK